MEREREKEKERESERKKQTDGHMMTGKLQLNQCL